MKSPPKKQSDREMRLALARMPAKSRDRLLKIEALRRGLEPRIQAVSLEAQVGANRPQASEGERTAYESERTERSGVTGPMPTMETSLPLEGLPKANLPPWHLCGGTGPEYGTSAMPPTPATLSVPTDSPTAAAAPAQTSPHSEATS